MGNRAKELALEEEIMETVRELALFSEWLESQPPREGFLERMAQRQMIALIKRYKEVHNG